MNERPTIRATIHHHAALARIEEMHGQTAARRQLGVRRRNEEAFRPLRLATAIAWRLAPRGDNA